MSGKKKWSAAGNCKGARSCVSTEGISTEEITGMKKELTTDEHQWTRIAGRMGMEEAGGAGIKKELTMEKK